MTIVRVHRHWEHTDWTGAHARLTAPVPADRALVPDEFASLTTAARVTNLSREAAVELRDALCALLGGDA